MEFLKLEEFKVTDLIDLVLVAVLLYYVYRLVRGTVAIKIFLGIVMVWGLWKLTEILDMKLISGIIGGFMEIGLIALIVVFQQEIREFLLLIGSTNLASKRNFSKHFKFLRPEEGAHELDINAVVDACESMKETQTGALLVIQRNNTLDFLKDSGDQMNAEVVKPLLESIFYKNSPLHDGAVVIKGNYIKATRVVLPVSQDRKIPLNYGLRHRAAMGISAKTDAVCLVVSEETGNISYIKDAKFVLFESTDELKEILENDLNV